MATKPKPAKPTQPPKAPDAIAMIAALDEQAIAERIGHLENELEALRVLQKAKHIQTHGKPERKPPGRKPKAAVAGQVNGSPVGPSQRERIIEFLRNRAPAKAVDIAAGANVPAGSVGAVLCDHRGKYFEQTPEGWRLVKGV